MALSRAWAGALLLLFLYGLSAFARSLQSSVSSLSNTSSADEVGLSILDDSSNNDEFGDCFDPTPPRRGLYPANEQDCLNAAKDLLFIRYAFRPITFARSRNFGFGLPRVVRNATCVILIDLMSDEDIDYFEPWLVYTTAVDITHRCTQGAFRFGGRTIAGPKKVVDVLVFGRVWPLDEGVVERNLLQSAVTVAGEPSSSGDSSLPNETSLNLNKRSVGNTTTPDEALRLNTPELGASLECYDPPLPRERAWPMNFEDCKVATDAIYKDKDQNQRYTFSRDPVATEFYYPLPAKFTHRSCVVLLDMKSDYDQDTVRLSIVEATAFVLAHKCSGEEKSVDRYGGRGTVGVGAQDLINVWVYGRLWPPPVDAMNATKWVLAAPATSIDSE